MRKRTTKTRRRPDGYGYAYGSLNCPLSNHTRYERTLSLTRRKRMRAGSGDGVKRRSEDEKKRNKRRKAWTKKTWT